METAGEAVTVETADKSAGDVPAEWRVNLCSPGVDGFSCLAFPKPRLACFNFFDLFGTLAEAEGEARLPRGGTASKSSPSALNMSSGFAAFVAAVATGLPSASTTLEWTLDG
eukprot:6202347-Pleurochrysis_carterae.AAC.8